MSTKTNYTSQEWELLKEVLFTTGALIILVSPSDPLGIYKETNTIFKAINEIMQPGKASELVTMLAVDKSDKGYEDTTEEDENEVTTTRVKQDTLANCRQVAALLAQKAAPEEITDYKQWVLQICKRVSEAAKEGGFFGIGGERVNQIEKDTLAEISAALGIK